LLSSNANKEDNGGGGGGGDDVCDSILLDAICDPFHDLFAGLDPALLETLSSREPRAMEGK
jgi:hypothetical protein